MDNPELARLPDETDASYRSRLVDYVADYVLGDRQTLTQADMQRIVYLVAQLLSQSVAKN